MSRVNYESRVRLSGSASYWRIWMYNPNTPTQTIRQELERRSVRKERMEGGGPKVQGRGRDCDRLTAGVGRENGHGAKVTGVGVEGREATIDPGSGGKEMCTTGMQ